MPDLTTSFNQRFPKPFRRWSRGDESVGNMIKRVLSVRGVDGSAIAAQALRDVFGYSYCLRRKLAFCMDEQNVNIMRAAVFGYDDHPAQEKFRVLESFL